MTEPIALRFVHPHDVSGPGDLRTFFWGGTAGLLLRAVRAVLLVESFEGAEALGEETSEAHLSAPTIRLAREAAHAIVMDMYALLPLAQRAARQEGYSAPVVDARAWEPGGRRRLAGALARVVAFEGAEELREVLVLLDSVTEE